MLILSVILKNVESYECPYSKNIKVSFLNLFVLMMNLVSQLLFLEVKMPLMNLLKRFIKSLKSVRK